MMGTRFECDVEVGSTRIDSRFSGGFQTVHLGVVAAMKLMPALGASFSVSSSDQHRTNRRVRRNSTQTTAGHFQRSRHRQWVGEFLRHHEVQGKMGIDWGPATLFP